MIVKHFFKYISHFDKILIQRQYICTESYDILITQFCFQLNTKHFNLRWNAKSFPN